MQRGARKSASDKYGVWSVWSCCRPGVLTELCWAINGVSHGKAALLAVCSRRKVAGVMPGCGHRVGTALPRAFASLGCSCWNAERQWQPERKGWRWWHDVPGWAWSVLFELLPWDGWVCLPRASQSRQVRGSRAPRVRKNHSHSSNKCHELLTSAVSSRAKCNSLGFFNYWN